MTHKNNMKARIIGTGSYLPKKVLTNSDLEEMVDTSDEWIVSRTGMKERRIAEGEHTSDMGIAAANAALKDAGIAAEDIDIILVATMTPDYIIPNTAALIQASVGATHAAAIDMQAACSGYLYGLAISKAFIEAGIYKKILLVATEKMSSLVDYNDRTTCIIFGDGAGAAVITNEGEGLLINDVCLGADGKQADLLTVPAGGSRQPSTETTTAQKLHYMQMNGKETFKHAVRRMEASSRECLEKSGLTEGDITWMIPHQANLRIIEAIGKRLKIADEKVFKTVHKYGNTSASSIAIALDELLKEKSVSSKDNILMTAFGAGLTWATAIVTRT